MKLLWIIHSVYAYVLEESLILKLEVNSSEKGISCYRGIAAIFTLSNIFVEYDTVFSEKYLTTIGELYAGGTSHILM